MKDRKAAIKDREEMGVGLPMLPGALSPAGRMVIALPDRQSAAAMANALMARGFTATEVRRFSAVAMSRWLKSLLPDAGRAVGYGPLVPGLRDFYILALEQCSWLVVSAPDDSAAQTVAEEARRAGARSTTCYRLPGASALAGTIHRTAFGNDSSASAGAMTHSSASAGAMTLGWSPPQEPSGIAEDRFNAASG